MNDELLILVSALTSKIKNGTQNNTFYDPSTMSVFCKGFPFR